MDHQSGTHTLHQNLSLHHCISVCQATCLLRSNHVIYLGSTRIYDPIMSCGRWSRVGWLRGSSRRAASAGTPPPRGTTSPPPCRRPPTLGAVGERRQPQGEPRMRESPAHVTHVSSAGGAGIVAPGVRRTSPNAKADTSARLRELLQCA